MAKPRFGVSGSCQSIHHMVLYENRVSRSPIFGEPVSARPVCARQSNAFKRSVQIGRTWISGKDGARRDFVTASTESHVRFDPYDVELVADPYPMFTRLRDEAPLYYNAE